MRFGIKASVMVVDRQRNLELKKKGIWKQIENAHSRIGTLKHGVINLKIAFWHGFFDKVNKTGCFKGWQFFSKS